MMRCSHVRRQLAIFRELTPAQQAEVRRHLAGCRACTAAWEAYRSQDVALAEWAAPTAALPPARDAWAQVRARVEAGQVAESPMRRRPALAVAMVALALCSRWAARCGASDTLPGQSLLSPSAAEQARLASPGRGGRARYASEMAKSVGVR
jgi:anti-sigma factor RsiW